jgi:hypothetical protein
MSVRLNLVALWVVGAGFVAAGSAGCKKPAEAQATDDGSADGGVAAAAEAPSGDIMAATVAPPDGVVAEDPNIPLNEAVVGVAPVPPEFSAPIAPPEPVVEDNRPLPPETDDVWTSGYWWWSPPLNRYVWVGGAWRHAPPDQVWTVGNWNLVNGHYFWHPGYWGPHGYVRVFADVAPPALRFEPYVAPPGVGFVWTPGYYDYRANNYVWVGGSWNRPPQVGLGWIEPHYVHVGARFVLQPGRWDFPAERRGIAFRPDINIHAGAHIHLDPVPHEVVVSHANFCNSAARAISRGATRAPNGAVVFHGTPPREDRRLSDGFHADNEHHDNGLHLGEQPHPGEQHDEHHDNGLHLGEQPHPGEQHDNDHHDNGLHLGEHDHDNDHHDNGLHVGQQPHPGEQHDNDHHDNGHDDHHGGGPAPHPGGEPHGGPAPHPGPAPHGGPAPHEHH